MKPKECCGVFGAYGLPLAAVQTYYGLYALQHRGQESAGIVVFDGETLVSRKGLGLLNEAITRKDLDGLDGELAVGHVRYSTTGSKRIQNIQPLVVEYARGLIAVAHNGNLVNARTLRAEYEADGSIFQTSTDSEIIVHLLADPRHHNSDIGHCLNHLKGAYSFVLMTKQELIGARDPFGFRPLALGRLNDAYVLASETCAFDLLGVTYEREVEPGEVVVIDKNGLTSQCFSTQKERAQCVFEHIYFARPDSYVFGKNVHEVRVNLGRSLAEEHPADADVVVAVPDSGNSAALGYSLGSGIPLDRGFIRNHYVGRTFIMPLQESRGDGVAIKLNVVRPVVEGKRVVVVDDSIIRGTTSKKRLSKLREAGAKEIHLRISCPPTRHPCYYGIDFPNPDELIASEKSVEEIRDFLEVDSLGYLSVERLRATLGDEKDDYCFACFTGEYPCPAEENMDKLALERHG